MKLKRKSKSKGLTLIELMLVVGIISIAMIGILDYLKQEGLRKKAELAGEQMSKVGNAVERLIALEGSNFKACLNNNQIIRVPIGAITQSTGNTVVGTCTITNRPLYPWNNVGVPTNAFGSTYNIDIKNQSNGYVAGLVTLSAPVRENNLATSPIRYDWLGMAAKKIGANGGGTFSVVGANRMNGVGAGWSITNADFPVVAQTGLLGYMTSVGGDLDNVYLRLDGAYPMRGDLNLGNFSINNVTDLNVNGWINGNNALVNNLKASYVAANHIQSNSINATTYITTGGRNPNIKPVGWGTEIVKVYDFISDGGTIGVAGAPNSAVLEAVITRRGIIGGNDFYFNGVGDGANFGSGLGNNSVDNTYKRYTGYLSDRLPRYVLKAAVAINSTSNGADGLVAKPRCTAAANSLGRATYQQAKIIVTPIFQNVYPEIFVEVRPQTNNSITTSYSRVGRDQLKTYAVDAGANWVVYGSSLMGEGVFGGYNHGRVLVQTFCDFEP